MVENEGRCKQRVLALVKDTGGRAATAHNLRVILIDRALRVPDVGRRSRRGRVRSGTSERRVCDEGEGVA
jgi:hypothetical protein